MKPDTNPTLEIVRTLPVLPLKNTVLFPNMFIPLSVGRASTRAAVEAAMSSEDKMFVVVVNRALKESHFRALKRGHEELPGEAGRAWEKCASYRAIFAL